MHTRWRHTATLLDAAADGPALLFVGTNPSCPDDAGQATFGPVRDLARHLGARWAGVVNLLALRAPDLRTVPLDIDGHELVAESRAVFSTMVAQVDTVIAAWGTKPGSGAADVVRDALEAERAWTLATAAEHGVPVVGIDGRPLHPSRWLLWMRKRSPARGNEIESLAALLSPLM